MRTSQLRDVLDYVLPCTYVKTFNVLAYDLFDPVDINKFPAAFILNTAKHNHPGIHWVGLFYKSVKESYFFCSYGKSVQFYGFKNIKPKKWNKRRYQSYDSNKCGHFAFIFIHQLSLGVSFENTLKIFHKNSIKNDAIVQKYIIKVYKLKNQRKAKSDQTCVSLRAFKHEYHSKHVRF